MIASFILCMLSTTLEEPFSSIRKAELAFHALERHVEKYKQALDGCAPEYSVQSSPGPPFDMYYHLEILHRMLPNLTRFMEEAAGEWYDLKHYDY